MTLVMQKKHFSKERAASPMGRTKKIIDVIELDNQSVGNKSKASLANSIFIKKKSDAGAKK